MKVDRIDGIYKKDETIRASPGSGRQAKPGMPVWIYVADPNHERSHSRRLLAGLIPVLTTLSWGWRPRLYAYARFANFDATLISTFQKRQSSRLQSTSTLKL